VAAVALNLDGAFGVEHGFCSMTAHFLNGLVIREYLSPLGTDRSHSPSDLSHPKIAPLMWRRCSTSRRPLAAAGLAGHAALCLIALTTA
jgi:hypothetical protein